MRPKPGIRSEARTERPIYPNGIVESACPPIVTDQRPASEMLPCSSFPVPRSPPPPLTVTWSRCSSRGAHTAPATPLSVMTAYRRGLGACIGDGNRRARPPLLGFCKREPAVIKTRTLTTESSFRESPCPLSRSPEREMTTPHCDGCRHQSPQSPIEARSRIARTADDDSSLRSAR
jgi:hypothetical protein